MVDISDEVELDLGLSIEGGFRRSKTLKPEERDNFEHSRRNDYGFDLDLREIQTTALRSNSSPTMNFANDVDSKTKREIHALRRQEAMKKQREKRCRSARGDSSLPDSAPSRASESQVSIISQDEEDERASKREKIMESNAISNNDAMNPIIFPVQLPYGPVHFVPYTRGFLYPCANMAPCWTTPIGGVGWPEKSAFRPFVAHPSFALNVVSQKNDKVVTKTTSDHDSPVCSSSTISDRQSPSSEGNGSRDTITHNSSQPSPEQSQQNGSSKSKDRYHNNKLESEAQSQPPQTTIEEQRPTKGSKPCPTGPNTNISNETKPVVIGKPPRPQCHKNNKTNNEVPSTETKTTALFPQMPYVSARGDGPDGKTVMGLLYRYNKSEEVCIVCVCHGNTFSPAEFVQHAGGTDVSNPLRHITVISPDF